MKKDKSKYIKKPNIFMYFLFRSISKLVSKFMFNLKFKRNEIRNLKGPYVVIANHESFIDFINLVVCNKHRMTFVVSKSFFNSMKINPLIKACGTIPKQQFQTSITDLKNMKHVIDDNRPLAFYPAGLMSDNGIATYIPKGTGKLLKWLNCDVYLAKTEGSYLTNPKWGKCGFRKGRITLDVYKLLSKDALNDFSADSLQKFVEDKLYYNAYDDQENNMIEYKKGDNIEGLENVLFKCLKCNHEFTHKIINKNVMVCNNCNNMAVADKFGFLNKVEDDDIVIKKVSDWSNKLENDLYQEISNNENYIIKDHAKIQMINFKKHQFKDVGECIISLGKEGFKLNGSLNNQPFNETISTKEFIVLPFKPGKYFEIQHGMDIYRILLDNPNQTSKWMLVLKSFYKLHHKEKETVKN